MERLHGWRVIPALIVLSVLSAVPCERAHTLMSQSVAPCDGLLVPERDAKACLECRRVALPSCRADSMHHANACRIVASDLERQLEIRSDRIAGLEMAMLAPKEAPGWSCRPS